MRSTTTKRAVAASERKAAALALAREKDALAEQRAKRKARWEKVRATVRAVGWRYRHQLAPLVLLGAIWLAGAALSGQPVGRALVVGVLGSLAALFWLRGTLPRREEQAYALACCAAATVWLVACAAAGVGHRWVGVLGIAAWLLASWRWWSHHEVRSVPEQPEALPDTMQDRWAANVAAKGSMKGSTLSAPVAFEHGQSHKIQLVPGDQHLGTAQQALPLISSGLKVTLDRLVLEQDPEHDEDPTVLRVQIVTNSPIKQTVLFDQPRHKDGKILLGPYGDGIGEATFRLFEKNSMFSGFILGGSGSGKSRLIESIAISALDMGNTLVLYLDGQDGASSPALWEHATWARGADDAGRVLAALERMARSRNRENRARGWSGFTPAPDRLATLVVVDEAHRIFPQHGSRWADLAVEVRKLGIGILGADQGADLTNTFGGQDRLRTALIGGNCVILRTNSRVQGNLIPGFGLDPYDLPVLPGYGYLVAPPGSDARTAPFRGRYLPDEDDKAEDPDLPVPTVNEWFTKMGARELDRVMARAAGPDYTERHERAEAERAALLAELTEENGAHHVPGPAVAQPQLHALPDEAIPAATARIAADDAATAQPITCRDAILDLPWHQHPEMTRAQIHDGIRLAGCDVGPSAVQKALDGEHLTRPGGELERAGHGRYRLAVAAH